MTVKNSLSSARSIVRAIDAKKGESLVAIDISALSPTVDFVILASGNVERHVLALSREVQEVMRREAGERPLYRQGAEHGDWVALDYFTIVVHLFTPEMRQKYQLERVWAEGTLIDLSLNPKELEAE